MRRLGKCLPLSQVTSCVRVSKGKKVCVPLPSLRVPDPPCKAELRSTLQLRRIHPHRLPSHPAAERGIADLLREGVGPALGTVLPKSRSDLHHWALEDVGIAVPLEFCVPHSLTQASHKSRPTQSLHF